MALVVYPQSLKQVQIQAAAEALLCQLTGRDGLQVSCSSCVYFALARQPGSCFTIVFHRGLFVLKGYK